MYFCSDVDLMAWEPGVFLEAAFGHQALVKEAPGTLTGTGLVMGEAVLGDVAPGMVAAVSLADGSATQLVEIAAVADASHATVSALRGRESEGAIGALVSGSVKVTVVSFRPQIAAVGDELLGLIGVESDRTSAPTVVMEKATGFTAAAVFGTLAAIYRTLAAATNASNVTLAKRTFYEGLWKEARYRIEATMDLDGDGWAETRVRAGVHALTRE